MKFILHGMTFKTQEGSNVVVTAHLLRHCFATHAVQVLKIPKDVVREWLQQKDIDVTDYYSQPTDSMIAEHHDQLLMRFAANVNLGKQVLRAPEEQMRLYEEAAGKAGTLADVEGGHCVSHGFCAAKFACVGCAGKVVDPTKRYQVERKKEWAKMQLDFCRAEGLMPEVSRLEQLIRDCDAELAEMDMMEQYRMATVSHSSGRPTSMSQTEAPSWLKEKVYEPKRQRTVHLVRQAVDTLVTERQKVSLASVSRKSKEMDPEGHGVSESAILNNPDAKAYYSRHKSWKGAPSHKSTGGGRTAAPVERSIDPNRDTGRVRQRLMRKGKDELANCVLELEQGFAVQEEQWLRLNDNLLQWRLRAEKAEAQVEKMRRALDAKDAQIRDLQKKVDDLYTTGTAGTDAEMRRALQDALKRAQEAEEQTKDLRLRMFAKRVVRMRDKARRLDKKGTAKLHRFAE